MAPASAASPRCSACSIPAPPTSLSSILTTVSAPPASLPASTACNRAGVRLSANEHGKKANTDQRNDLGNAHVFCRSRIAADSLRDCSSVPRCLVDTRIQSEIRASQDYTCSHIRRTRRHLSCNWSLPLESSQQESKDAKALNSSDNHSGLQKDLHYAALLGESDGSLRIRELKGPCDEWRGINLPGAEKGKRFVERAAARADDGNFLYDYRPRFDGRCTVKRAFENERTTRLRH